MFSYVVQGLVQSKHLVYVNNGVSWASLLPWLLCGSPYKDRFAKTGVEFQAWISDYIHIYYGKLSLIHSLI